MDILGNESAKVLDLAYLNSLYHTGVSNPLDSALLQSRHMPGRELYFQELAAQYPKLDELPFDYERRFASVLVRNGEENLLIIKGSIDEVYLRCSSVEYKGERHAISGEGMASVRAIVDEMLEDGLVEEVKRLKEEGCTRGMVSMQGLGYKEILAYLEGEYSLEEAVRILKRDTRHFAKRQLTWFRRERDVIWVNKDEFDYREDRILEYMLSVCREKGMKGIQ